MIKVIAFFTGIAAAIGYYFFVYPPVVLKRATDKALMHFADTVETKDRAKIGEVMQALFTENATIRLEINFFSFLQNNNPPVIQDFTKQSFISFIDNTLYPLTDYAYYPRLKTFKLAEDRSSAQIKFSSQEWADGANYYGGVAVNMRFSSDTSCESKIIFTGETPHIEQLNCKMQFRAVPKPEDIQKLQNLDSVKDLLIQQR